MLGFFTLHSANQSLVVRNFAAKDCEAINFQASESFDLCYPW